jgi:hypothetical protein
VIVQDKRFTSVAVEVFISDGIAVPFNENKISLIIGLYCRVL